MKKYLFFALTALMVAGCSKSEDEETESLTAKKITFSVDGDFMSPSFTRALSANGTDMTELWAFDFVDEECVQFVHQTSDDADFGSPSFTMSQGDHIICFVVSRGEVAALDEDSRTIEWTKPSDTFWNDNQLTVSQSTPDNIAVTLNRVATRLRVVVNDEVPAGLASVDITPAKWFYGLNYWTGDAAVPKTNATRSISIPSSYVGTTNLTLSIFGLSTTNEWQTDVNLVAKNGEGATISSISIADAPFKANRTTAYSGRLFTNSGAFSLSLNDEWDTDYTGTW